MTIVLGFIAVTLALVFVGAAHRAVTVVRVRQRAAWESDRMEWRRWISRP